MKSLSQKAIDIMSLPKKDYLVKDDAGEMNMAENSGNCLLKLVIMESDFDTKSTANRILGKLTFGMPTIAEVQGNNIIAFNRDIKILIKRVKHRCLCQG